METILNRVETQNPNGEIEITGITHDNGETRRLVRIATDGRNMHYRKRTTSPVLRDSLLLYGDCHVVTTDAEGLELQSYKMILENPRNNNWILLTDAELQTNFELIQE